MHDLPKTMTEAKQLGLKQYYTGVPCKNGHDAKRYVATRSCSKCAMQRCRKYQLENPEKVRPSIEKSRKKYEANKPDKIKKAKADYKIRNAQKIAEAHREYNRKNKDAVNKRNAAYKKAFPCKNAALSNKRRAIKIKACPSWADLSGIELVYKKSNEISKQTGIAHHVDHIVPLQGKTVCGLHIVENLRVITAKENAEKNNKFTGG